jgi:hypothetical protein
MKFFYILILLLGFSINTSAQFCSGTTVLTECSGEFDDGSGSSDYANNSDCSWRIQVPQDSTILLTFNSFETQSCCDILRVYNGPNSSAPLRGEYGGIQIPEAIQSTSNELFLEFETNGSFTQEGWSVSYTCNSESFVDLTYDNSSSRLLDADGSILEYDFAFSNFGNLDAGPFEVGFYASDDIEIDTSDVLMLTLPIDSLAAQTTMNLSGMQDVRDSLPPGVYSHIGFIIDPQNEIDELSNENNTYLERNERIYIPYCDELTTITGCEGMISDGSGFDDVARYTQCSWRIESENNESIYLEFLNVALSSSDYINIYDGDDSNALLIQAFSGNENFYPVVSTGGSIFIEFNNSASSEDGWDAEYFCTDTTVSNLIMETFSDATSTQSTVDFELDIRNNGNAASPETKVYFYGSEDFDFDMSEDILIDSVELPSIQAMDEFQLNYTMDARFIIPPGSYRPIAVIDAFNRVDELNEEDNLEVFGDRFHIPYCADTTTVLEDCSGIVSDGSGIDDFTPGSDCSWLIEADSGQFVSLSLLNADLGSSATLLRFYDGEDNSSPLMAEFRGNRDDEIPSDILSKGKRMYIEFITGTSTFGTGWDFQYECTEETAVNFDFVGDFNIVNLNSDEVRYSFDVRNFGNVPTPESKIYFIISPDPTVNANDIVIDSVVLGPITPYFPVTVIRSVDLSLLPSSIPGGDYYTGFFIDPLDEVTEINEDDNSYMDQEIFTLPYCSQELQLIDDCVGTLTDGSGDNNYADGSDCRWLIEGPPGSNISLTFNDFRTQSCCDFLRVYDGTSNSDPLLGSFSGSTLPPDLQTTAHQAYLEFETNSSFRNPGWELEYECIQFFADLQFKSGSTQFQVVENTLNFAAIIENIGSLPTGEFSIGFILSEDKIPNIGDFILASETIESLETDEETDYQVELDLRNLGIPAGDYFLIARLDLQEVVEENDETNNDFISAFPIDILSSVENPVNKSEIRVHYLAPDIVIRNNRQRHIKKVSLVNVSGMLLWDQQIDHSSQEIRIENPNYPAGIYFVRLDLGSQIIVKKLFIPF